LEGLTRAVRWFAGLPLTIVAVISLWPGLVASYTWNEHWVLLVGLVPVLAWALLQQVLKS
ncbi:MAG: hypothetical protein ABIP08_12245, partial [Lautropia sp.]